MILNSGHFTAGRQNGPSGTVNLLLPISEALSLVVARWITRAMLGVALIFFGVPFLHQLTSRVPV